MPEHPDRGADSPDYLSRRTDPFISRGIKFPVPPSARTPLGHGLGFRHGRRPLPLSVAVAVSLAVVLVIFVVVFTLAA
jgi:hypothetical protein